MFCYILKILKFWNIWHILMYYDILIFFDIFSYNLIYSDIGLYILVCLLYFTYSNIFNIFRYFFIYFHLFSYNLIYFNILWYTLMYYEILYYIQICFYIFWYFLTYSDIIWCILIFPIFDPICLKDDYLPNHLHKFVLVYDGFRIIDFVFILQKICLKWWFSTIIQAKPIHCFAFSEVFVPVNFLFKDSNE